MTISVLTSGQVGSDGTGTLTGTHDPGSGITPDAVVVFIVQGDNQGSSVNAPTYGGVTMSSVGASTDNSGEPGAVYAYYLSTTDSIATGSQTVTCTVTAAYTRRMYVVSLSTDADGIDYYSVRGSGGDQANPSQTLAIPSDYYVAAVGCLYYGGSTGSVSVASGTQLAESSFNSSQTASLCWSNSTVNDADLTLGWTATSDDVAYRQWFMYELAEISGNVTIDAVAQQNAIVQVGRINATTGSHVSMGSELTDASGDWSTFVGKGNEVYVSCVYDDGGGNVYTSPVHWNITA